jgi:glycine/D-amino acid oxidase-like deaminating enzyme
MSKTSAPQPRIIIIGAGIVGANLADELVSRGQNNILVLEQGPLRLPGGSTFHAPGFVYSTNASKSMTEFAQYTIRKFSGLIQADGTSCFRAVGGLEIATTPERLTELHRRAGWNRSYGVPAEVVDVDRVAELHPMLDPSKVLGGLWTPTDGRALAAEGTSLLIRRTQAAGVEYRDLTTVTGIEQAGGKVTGVLAGEDRFEADIVVCCAGFWGAHVGALADTVVPLLPLAHQFAWSTPLPELTARKNEAGGAVLFPSCATRTRPCTTANGGTGSASAPTPTAPCPPPWRTCRPILPNNSTSTTCPRPWSSRRRISSTSGSTRSRCCRP